MEPELVRTPMDIQMEGATDEKDNIIKDLREQLKRCEAIGRRETEEALRVTQDLIGQLKMREELCEKLREQVEGCEKEKLAVVEINARLEAGMKDNEAQWNLERTNLTTAFRTLKTNIDQMVKRLDLQLEEQEALREAEKRNWEAREADLLAQIHSHSTPQPQQHGEMAALSKIEAHLSTLSRSSPDASRLQSLVSAKLQELDRKTNSFPATPPHPQAPPAVSPSKAIIDDLTLDLNKKLNALNAMAGV
eukprot:TRINITY_DN6556_c0_g1_i1.p1 TRINITY_DN6556_c0_g1~~TRINITY_DN6556_c0_g1_i1.p1  ORF type:complete len:249 (+),score=64.96 TRINITY_DN6556_c0_g1_i1:116-862(+)